MVPKKILTDRAVAALKPAERGKRKLLWDAAVHSFAVRVTDTGAKSFVLVARFPGSPNPTARAIGRTDAISLEKAREIARGWLGELAQGRDPARVAEARATGTVRAVCEEWWTRKGSNNRSAKLQRSRLERLIYPALGHRPIGEVKRSDIVRLHDRVTDENGPVAANRAVELLGSIFSWHATRSDDFHSPIIRGMTTAEASRDRVLTDEELKAVWHATAPSPGLSLHPSYRALIRFLLLTGARRAEAARMRWAELAEGVWTLPPERNKVGVELVRPLSGAALAVLDGLPRSGEWVFTRRGSQAIGGLAELKTELDRLSGMSNWVHHDLRRTARSLLSRAGVNADVAELCLGHVLPGIRQVYDRYKYAEEKRIAYEKLASLIAQIVEPQENVVAIRGQR